MSARPHRRALALALILAVTSVGDLSPAAAHTPHDVVIDVEVSPAFVRDHTVYAIARDYLLKSEDEGDTWTRLVRGLDHRFQLRAVEVSAQDEHVLFVGSRGDGIYRSADGGSTWAKTPGALPSLDVRALALSPHSSDLLFATIAVGEGLEVFRTEDGGETWSGVPDAGPASVIEFAPEDSAVVLSGSEDGHLRRSSDGGRTWSDAVDLSTSGEITAIAVVPDASNGKAIFLGTTDDGLLTSTDGRSFTSVGEGITDPSIMSIALSPDFLRDQRLWVSTYTTGAFGSTDGGATWNEQAEGLTTDPQADQLGRSQFGPLSVGGGETDPVLYLGGFDGLFRSDGAGAWHEVTTQSSSTISSLAISPAYGDDHTLAVATYLNGAFRSVDGGRTWTAINDGLAYEGVWTRAHDYYARLISIAFSPEFAADQTLFGSERGYVLRSPSAGDEWTAQIPEGLLVKGEAPPDYALWTFSPEYGHDHTALLGTSRGKVFVTTDGGSEFDKIGQLDAPVSAIATSPAFASDQTVLAGTPFGMQRSTDAGRTWEHIGLPGLEVTSLAVAPDFGTSGRVFVGTTAGLFTTEGHGWTPITGAGLTETSPIEAVAVSPEFAADGTVLTSVKGQGLYRSVDGGVTFAPVADALLDDDVVLGNFYHRATEAIVFSPDYARDHTVFGTAGEALFTSTDGGENWDRLVLPVSTHGTAVEDAPSPLLPRIVGEDDHHAAGADQPAAPHSEGSTASGVLLATACALVTFAGLTALRRRSIGGRQPFGSLAARAAGAGVVLALGMLLSSA